MISNIFRLFITVKININILVNKEYIHIVFNFHIHEPIHNTNLYLDLWFLKF